MSDPRAVANALQLLIRRLADDHAKMGKDIAELRRGLAELEPFIPPAAEGEPAAPKPPSPLTVRSVLEIVEHEAIVREAYKDSEGVWTWSVGITNASGHQVYPRYKDNPQTLEHCLAVYVWLLENAYLPDVLKAFAGITLAEHQLAAALSFHWNTGAILTTTWVKLIRNGKPEAAREFLETHYLNGGTLQARRKAEARLFFDGAWIGDGRVTVWPVVKPSYRPDWSHPEQADITDAVKAILATA